MRKEANKKQKERMSVEERKGWRKNIYCIPWHVHSCSSKQNKCLVFSSTLSRMCTRKREWIEAREEKRNGDDGEKKAVRKRGKKSGIAAKFLQTYARMRVHANVKEKT